MARDPQLANLLNEEILGENSRSRPEAVVTYCEGRERGLSPKFTDQNLRRAGGSEDYRQNLPIKSVVAAATEYDYYSKDDNPGAVIVKDMA